MGLTRSEQYINLFIIHRAQAMTPNLPADDTESNRQRILDAAEGRFRTYGFGKTTMAEIAEDVDMSAANLYRYFENKQDIAGACAQRCMGERLQALRSAVRTPSKSAAERLRLLVSTMLDHTHERASDDKKINELVEIVARERRDIIDAKVQSECALIAEILSYGNERGEFDIEDVIATSRAVHCALTLFDVPLFMPLFSREEFGRLADGVLALLLRGLLRRAA